MSLSVTRRESVPRFVEKMATRHPELRAVVTFDAMLRMAQRDRVSVRVVPLPAMQNGRTVVFGQRVFVRINRLLTRAQQTVTGMHELCHVWRDTLRLSPYYSDEVTGGASCMFADIFAWYVTSPARPLFDPKANQIEIPLPNSFAEE